MNRIAALIVSILLSSIGLAGDNVKHELSMSFDDTFVVVETDEWKVDVQRLLQWRFADVNITPRHDKSFDLQLYFKCDTPDLSLFDSTDKIRTSVITSSEKYLPYIVEKRIECRELSVKGWYGWYTVLTDAELADEAEVPDGEFKYMTRGMIRLSSDSALGFSLMTNELGTPDYQKLFDYVLSFVKEKELSK